MESIDSSRVRVCAVKAKVRHTQRHGEQGEKAHEKRGQEEKW